MQYIKETVWAMLLLISFKYLGNSCSFLIHGNGILVHGSKRDTFKSLEKLQTIYLKKSKLSVGFFIQAGNFSKSHYFGSVTY